MLDEESFLKVFRLFSFSLLCFFSLSRFALNFFFFGSARGFFFQQATTFDSSLKQTREKKEKTLKPFSLFSFLSLILITLLSRLHKGREDEPNPVLFILLPCVVKFYIERKTVRKEERLILIGLRIIIRGGREKPKIDEEETF